MPLIIEEMHTQVQPDPAGVDETPAQGTGGEDAARQAQQQIELARERQERLHVD